MFKSRSLKKGKKNVKNVSKTNFVKGESFNKEGETIEKGSNSEFVKQKAKGSNEASSSSNSECEDDQKEKNEKIDKRRCYKCRLKGHLAANCPNENGKSRVDPDLDKPFDTKPQNEPKKNEKKSGKTLKGEKPKVVKQESKPVSKQKVKNKKQMGQDTDSSDDDSRRGSDRGSESSSAKHESRQKTPARRPNIVTFRPQEQDQHFGGSNNQNVRPLAQNHYVDNQNVSPTRFHGQRQHSGYQQRHVFHDNEKP
ncbi:general transcription factor IIF subunit 1-like [Helianthus annuus]|uniref:general transcription factor IIF subunit 1-like n=1 Tax=Helianthus annuus TaxID=4232 RepID=UPI000B90221D|nr:general transcription factor IIF subunit 1-like [Helianthus annuus]